MEDGIHVHWLPVSYGNEMGYAERVSAFFRFAIGAAQRAARIPADVVFATSTPLTIALPGIFAARRQRCPMVFEVRDLWPDVPIAVGAIRNPLLIRAARFLELLAYRNAAAVVALSPDMASGVRQRCPTCPEIAVIPNAADLDVFMPDSNAGDAFRRECSIPADRFLVIYAGTFGMVNDVGYLAQVAATTDRGSKLHFLTVGSGREYALVEQTATELGVLGRNFTMLKQVPKSRMRDVFAAADVSLSLVAPIRELEANSANKFFDGLSAGCCVAINYGGWQADLLEKSGAGFQLSRNPAHAARQLESLAGEPERLHQHKIAARRLAEGQFSRDALALRLEQVLMRAVQR
jgi:glycosyltransferase involved in cell wall biosynthesis